MADELSDAVERLRTSADHLNRLCDQAAELIRDVEHFLEEARVGIWGSVSLGFGASSPDADTPDWEDKLAYCRLDSGKFRIAVIRTYLETPPEDRDVIRAWSECTRDEKLESLEKLPELLVELAKQVVARTAKAEKTLSSVSFHMSAPKKRKGGLTDAIEHYRSAPR